MVIKKIKLKIIVGVLHVYSTSNNTIITITEPKGNTISWVSAGSIGFKGTRKSTPFALQSTSEAAIKMAINLGLRRIEIILNGKGPGRPIAIRAIRNSGLKVLKIIDMTSEPHNGCRSARKRRI